MVFLDPKVQLDRYVGQIEEFEKEPVQKGLILFYGDSGFMVWKNTEYGDNPRLEDVILGKDGKKACVNHGFGGSTAEEQLYYYERAVRPWAPRALVLQTVGNDLASGYTPLEVIFLQARLIEYARRDFPGIKIYVCNSIPRQNYKSHSVSRIVALNEYNELAKLYCDKHEDTTLIDEMNVPMFYDDPAHVGEIEHIRDELYISDRVHLNREGYELYGRLFKEKLKYEL